MEFRHYRTAPTDGYDWQGYRGWTIRENVPVPTDPRAPKPWSLKQKELGPFETVRLSCDLPLVDWESGVATTQEQARVTASSTPMPLRAGTQEIRIDVPAGEALDWIRITPMLPVTASMLDSLKTAHIFFIDESVRMTFQLVNSGDEPLVLKGELQAVSVHQIGKALCRSTYSCCCGKAAVWPAVMASPSR